jgi:hypothetical protein
MSINIEDFYKNNILDKNFDEVFHQEQFPETKDFYQPYCKENNIDDKRRLYFHYYFYCQREICIKVNNGLANRLRTLNSFWNFSQQTNSRRLKVCWEKGQGWSNDHFLDLFEPLSNHIEFISLEEYEEIRLSGKYIHLDKLIFKSDFDISVYSYVEPKKHIFEQIKKHSFCYDGDSCLEYMFDEIEIKQEIYQKIQPNIKIKNYINKILYETPQIKDSIGLHIRRGDCLNHPWKDLYRISDNQSFEKNIEEHLKKDPNTKFFLATDCADTNNYFASKYKNIVFYNQYKKFVESTSYLLPKDNQTDAVVDLFLLSKTKCIVGSNNSSFSAIAARLGNLNLTISKNNDTIKKFKKSNVIKINYLKSWQFPAYTEKQAYLNHTNKNFHDSNKIYIGFPWASLIDDITKHFGNNYENWEFDNNVINYFKNLEPMGSLYTVCQHIMWKSLIPLWKKIGINNIYVSHLINNDLKNTELNLHSWHLIAPNAENGWLNEGMIIKTIKQKKYLFSFIGAYNKYYRSDIREKLNDLFGQCKNKDMFFEFTNKWFLDEIVYGHQINNKSFNLSSLKNKSKSYNSILSDSVFSLCPEGTGPNTLRLWESMSVGSVPVLFENDWVKPELEEGMSWDELVVTVKNNEMSNLEEKLKIIDIDKVQKMSLNCINAYNKFRLKTCF